MTIDQLNKMIASEINRLPEDIRSERRLEIMLVEIVFLSTPRLF
jgi:hypothetical protein